MYHWSAKQRKKIRSIKETSGPARVRKEAQGFNREGGKNAFKRKIDPRVNAGVSKKKTN